MKVPPLLVIFITSYLLFAWAQAQKDLTWAAFKYKKKDQIIQVLEKRIDEKLSCDNCKILLKAYLLGQRSDLSTELKKVHENLNLQHLTTPSGLHLSSFLLIFFFLKGKHQKKKKWIFTALLLPLFFLQSFYSLKRMALLKIIYLWIPISNSNKKIKSSFILAFAMDFIIGNFSSSPLSFCYSFLFLGTILYAPKGKLFLLFSLMAAQFLAAHFSGQILSPLNLVLNFLLSSLFTMIFPIIVFSFSTNLFSVCELGLSFFLSTLNLCGDLASTEGGSFSDFFFLFFIFLTIFKRKSAWLFLFLSSANLNPYNNKDIKKYIHRNYYINVEAVHNRMEYKPKKLVLFYPDKIKCYRQLINDKWYQYCLSRKTLSKLKAHATKQIHHQLEEE